MRVDVRSERAGVEAERVRVSRVIPAATRTLEAERVFVVIVDQVQGTFERNIVVEGASIRLAMARLLVAVETTVSVVVKDWASTVAALEESVRRVE